MSKQTQPAVTVDQINAWLPQTQCTQCGYPGCRAYAEAIARGRADINQCPPGDGVTIQGLAALLHTAPKPLNPRFGSRKPRARAVIEEVLCIGCRKCIEVCPVDAIIGARKLMHTVIAQVCTGCELCLPPCPVNCIMMVPAGEVPTAGPWPEYARSETRHWQTRTDMRLKRLARRRRQVKSYGAVLPSSTESIQPLPNDRERIQSEIRAACERVKRKRQASGRNAR